MFKKNQMEKQSQIESMPVDFKEKEIWDLLDKATNLFSALPDKHPSAPSEWCFYMHGLQGLMQHRICKKLYPDYFR